MRYWLAKVVTAATWQPHSRNATWWSDLEEKVPSPGDIVFPLAQVESSEWSVASPVQIAEVTSREGDPQYYFDVLANPIPEPRANEASNLAALWMSLSGVDRRRVKQCLSYLDPPLVNLSPTGAEVLRTGREFPMGNLLRLMLQTFGAVASGFLAEVRFADNERGIDRWGRAASSFYMSVQSRIMAPAYWAEPTIEVWHDLAQRLADVEDGVPPNLGSHVFLGQRTRENAGPPRLVASIPFEDGVKVADLWGVTRLESGEVGSALLEKLFRQALIDQETADEYGPRFPAYPGALTDELP